MSKISNIIKRREYNGPAFFSGGFKPFFFSAGVFAILAVGLWVAYVSGHGFGGIMLTSQWHAHEMLFGFVAAAVAGFSLTAIPNWTGRLPLRGMPLALLFMVWLAGRIFMLNQSDSARIVDSIFLILLTFFAGREVWAGKNWRNAPVVLVFGVFASANIMFHLQETGHMALGGSGFRLGVASIVMLLSLIGGRIVPSFTENWLKKTGNNARTVAFNVFDKTTLLISLIVFLTWVFKPNTPLLAYGFFIISGLHLARLSRWQGWHTVREPLVLMLHMAYLWLPIAFALLGVEMLYDIPNVGVHSLTTGAMASMIIAVMTRATLGHAGQSLSADMITVIIYIAVWLAGLTRVISFFQTGNYIGWLQLSATLWVVGFGLFVISYSRYFFRAND